MGPVAGEQVELVERSLVEQVLDPLAGQHLALGVLALDGSRRPGVEGLLAPLLRSSSLSCIGLALVTAPTLLGP